MKVLIFVEDKKDGFDKVTGFEGFLDYGRTRGGLLFVRCGIVYLFVFLLVNYNAVVQC